ncbi:hypothetical protein FRC01_011325 [Tulasnella sp. 417]|nr:hypothetical protein FRC01_011325 [Tulasnella sp. 417]
MDALQITFHGKFNFHDGNLVVSASGPRNGLRSSPTETVYFRLHKSILATYSTSFADMLQGEGVVEQPVIHLQDPLDHVIKLFTLIYYGGLVPLTLFYVATTEFMFGVPSFVPLDPLSRAKWDFLVPVLTLTNKYNMGSLATRLLPRLLEDWPTTLENWDSVDARTRSIVLATARERETNFSLPSADDVLPEPVMAIKFGQANPAARNMLPAAFYHLSRLSYSRHEDIGGWNSEGPEVFRSADHNLMTPEDWVRLVRGQANIREWLTNMATYYNVASALPECPRRVYEDEEAMDEGQDEEDEDGEGDPEGTPNPCGRRDWWATEIRPLVLEVLGNRVVDVLAQLRRIRAVVKFGVRDTTSEDDLCYDCQISLEKWLEESRNRFWMLLPFFFNLGDYPNWGT